MQYYFELTLINSSEIKTYELWSKLYMQIHLALVEVKAQNNMINIGLSFPEYHFCVVKRIGFLGSKLRLFAKTKEDLQQLNINQWLEQLVDYVHISSIRNVPQDTITDYVSFVRKQVKTNAERLARRLVKKCDGINFDEAVKLYQNKISLTDLPYVQMKSLTNNQPFKLFIQKNIGEKTDINEFNVYGLSKVSTVPEF